MRLIDADKVSAIITRLIEEQKKSHNLNEVIGLTEARTEVNNAPTVPQWINAYDMHTIDTAPVVHAHWMPEHPNKRTGKSYSHKCSGCGRTVYNNRQVSIKELGYVFCPHCGAKMDEEDEDEA